MGSKKKIPVVGKIEPQINRYYLGVSRKYMAAGIFFMMLIIVYIVFVMVFLGKYVTYENLRYLVRDIDAITLLENGEAAEIVYNGGDGMKTKSFRGGLALTSGDSYMYYDAGGVLLTENSINYSTPEMACSGKYMLVYDIGGVGYSVYNQLTCIIERESSQRIVCGDISDDGAILLVTRSRETKYVAELYNSAFAKSMSIYKENYVLDCALSPDGEYIILASGVPQETDLACEISICRKNSDSPLFTTMYTHTMPLDIFTEEDGFVLLCDNGIYFFDYSGVITSSFSFAGMSLRYSNITSSSAVVVGSVNALGSENRCVVFDSTGGVLYNAVLDERITGAYAGVNMTDAYAYLTTPDSVIQIEPSGELDRRNPESEVLSVVPVNNGALLCSKTSAKAEFAD